MVPSKPPTILVVDDEEPVRDILSRWLTADGYRCLTAASADEAWPTLADDGVALSITDIMMPGRSGIDLLLSINARGLDTAVLMVTALDDRETAIRALQLGAYGYLIKPFDRNEILINVANALERRRLALAGKRYQQRLEEEVWKRTSELRRREQEIVLHLLSAAELRDDETGAHIRRIGLYAGVLAEELGWEQAGVEHIQLAASMHDVGKIGVPDRILRKPGRLTGPERSIMKTHTTIGAQILDGSDVSLLQMARDIALSHHEKWDGSGYPRGISGTEIHMCARIVAVADVYDALLHGRVYRPALPEDEALDTMAAERGKHFDPRVLDCFNGVRDRFRHIRETVSEGAAEAQQHAMVDRVSPVNC